MANYTYSMDLSSYFADKVIEEAKPDTGIMQRNKSKAEATEKPKDEYDPYGFMPNFAKALAVSYPNEEMGKKALGVAAPKLDTGVQSAFIQMYLDGLAPPVTSQAPEQPVAPPGGITNLEKPSLTMGTGMDAYAPPSELSDTPDAGDAFTESLFAALEETAPERKAAGEQAAKGEGLMSRRLDSKGETPVTDFQKYTTEYAETYLAQHEGLKPHKSLEGGKDTAALGVKFSLGLKREDYKTDAGFAAAVALKHRDKAKAKFKEADWEALPDSVKYAIVDLNYNTGGIGSTADKTSTVDKMKNTLDFIGMTTKEGEKASLISLAKRRAWNWNKAAEDIGQSKIAKIKQIPTDSGGTKFEYLDEEGNIIHSLITSRSPVILSSNGTATTLTTTRELTL